MALRAAQAAGHGVRGATAWVTLEPCAHHGRTPPCCDALIAAGLARVVVAIGDPNPQVAGQGLQRLRAAGLKVDVAQGALALAARELNIGFFSRHERGRPWVRLKLAMSLDGRTALNNGTSQWITGPDARADGHAWRRRAGAILTGIGTVLADNPRLDVRDVASRTQPLRVVVDSTLRMPAAARILEPPGRLLIATTIEEDARINALREAGAEIMIAKGSNGQVDLSAMTTALAARQINEVHVEAGSILSGALIAQSLVDEILVYLAPLLLGPGRDAVNWAPLSALSNAPRFRYSDMLNVGGDLRLRARPQAL
jgi:diaminohydroxyphosphoribosylaminopyrimidine deaminase/5-amino-6-(5-phosphoribosylamino)uracil reductase